jgi:hypothetical protein
MTLLLTFVNTVRYMKYKSFFYFVFIFQYMDLLSFACWSDMDPKIMSLSNFIISLLNLTLAGDSLS